MSKTHYYWRSARKSDTFGRSTSPGRPLSGCAWKGAVGCNWVECGLSGLQSRGLSLAEALARDIARIMMNTTILLRAFIIAISITFLLIASWCLLSPRMALTALSDWDRAPEDLAVLYDQESVRAAFERQTLPQVDTYPPPWTKDVVLDALSDPRAIRMLVIEPYGEWQFAAAEGLPPKLRENSVFPTGGRILETTESWSVDWIDASSLIATPSQYDDREGNRYRFKRDGLGWRLVAIELTTEIR